MLRAFIAFAIAFAVAAGSASAAGPKSKRQPFATPEEIQHWIKNYRAAPQPRQLPAAVKAMSRLGIFREVFKDVEIVPVPSRDLLYAGGNIHCITQQEPLVLQTNKLN
mgnify:CR=1 FL=1